MSDKTDVIEHLFFRNWDASTKTLRKSAVDQREVVAAIQHCNAIDGKGRSARNPANFLKDLVRTDTASKNWPSSVAGLKYTAIQRTGGNLVFEFVPYSPGQTEPFPDPYKCRPGVRTVPVQSLTIWSESKQLGRRDEAWLTQVAVKLAVLETHFAVSSPLRGKVRDIVHLQMSVKLRSTEIDAMYMARIEDSPGLILNAAITVEAKQAHERILENQLVAQAKASFSQQRYAMAIPIGMRAVHGRGIYIAEFGAVLASNAAAYSRPILVDEALYELQPNVPGI